MMVQTCLSRKRHSARLAYCIYMYICTYYDTGIHAAKATLIMTRIVHI